MDKYQNTMTESEDDDTHSPSEQYNSQLHSEFETSDEAELDKSADAIIQDSYSEIQMHSVHTL